MHYLKSTWVCLLILTLLSSDEATWQREHSSDLQSNHSKCSLDESDLTDFWRRRREPRLQVTARIQPDRDQWLLLMGSKKAFSRSGKSPFSLLEKKMSVKFHCENPVSHLLLGIPLFSRLQPELCKTSVFKYSEFRLRWTSQKWVSKNRTKPLSGKAIVFLPWDEQNYEPVYRIV